MISLYNFWSYIWYKYANTNLTLYFAYRLNQIACANLIQVDEAASAQLN